MTVWPLAFPDVSQVVRGVLCRSGFGGTVLAVGADNPVAPLTVSIWVLDAACQLPLLLPPRHSTAPMLEYAGFAVSNEGFWAAGSSQTGSKRP
jgi:hypothetical protein